jgi:serine/threonine protein kinase
MPDEEELFWELQAIDDPEERNRVLRERCGDGTAIQQRIARLLAAEERSGRYFECVDSVWLKGQQEVLDASLQSQIGPYKILELLGEGGFGQVFVAEQRKPVRRTVALKLIKLGMDTKEVVARFEAERQALAMMNHPNIARILDAGSTENGRPYFVMELVRGVPITRFCDQHRLDLEQRLELFLNVCDAMHHAHQKGVMHRDLKPSNIMVALDGTRFIPKVIDFGIAKAMDQPLTDKTLHTCLLQFIGTPDYVSPEQAEMSDTTVDIRSDIYSLGVILYELITGKTPFEFKEMTQGNLEKMRTILKREGPLTPTLRLKRLNEEERTTAAQSRGCQADQLVSNLGGDLDNVVLKAIAKDPVQRYGSASAMAEDIRRYIRHEPVVAIAPSRRYVFRKFVQRHGLAVGTAFCILTALLLCLGLAILGYHKASESHRLANAKAEEALSQLEENEAVHQWLLEGLLGMPQGERSIGKERDADISLKDALIESVESLETQLTNQPGRKGKIYFMIARALESLNEREKNREYSRRAYELLRSAEGANGLNTLMAQRHLGWHLVVDYYQPNATEDSPTKLLGEEGMALLKDAHSRYLHQYGPDYAETLSTALLMGLHYVNGGQLKLGAEWIIPTLRMVKKLANSSSWEHYSLKTRALKYLSSLRAHQMQINEARMLLNQCLNERDARRRAKDEDAAHDNVFADYYNMLSQYSNMTGDFGQAIEYAQKGLEISIKNVGNGFPTRVLHWDRWYAHFSRMEMGEAAEAILRDLEIQQRSLGPSHRYTLESGRSLVKTLASAARWKAASAECRRQREIGIVDGHSLISEMLMNYLSGDAEEVPSLMELFWNWMDNKPDLKLWSNALVPLLALQTDTNDREKIIKEAQKALSNKESQKWGAFMRSLVEGLIEFHTGALGQAGPLIESVAQNLHDRRTAALARLYLAIIQHRQGFLEEARNTLHQARDLLSELLHAGNLDLVHPRYDNWKILAVSLVVRDLAEKEIFGEIVSAPLTGEFMEQSWKAWKPVHDLINGMERAARHQDDEGVRYFYAEARAHPAFRLETMMEFSQWFQDRLSFPLLKLGDYETFFAHLRQIFNRDDGPLPPEYLSAATWCPVDIPKDMKIRVEDGIRFYLEETMPLEKEGNRKDYQKHMMHVGVALYRLDRHQEALNCLKVGAEDTWFAKALVSRAFAALAAWKAGNQQDAVRWNAEVSKEFQEMLELSQGDWGINWKQLAIVEMALQEADQLFGTSVSRTEKRK